eukprot:scaffold2001_cov115-Pinguiococcus_pyrenoidosus.AAC.1
MTGAALTKPEALPPEIADLAAFFTAGQIAEVPGASEEVLGSDFDASVLFDENSGWLWELESLSLTHLDDADISKGSQAPQQQQ